METKPKVDVKAIIAKANAKTKEVQKSTEKVLAKQDTYKIVPGFDKYEFNGVILRNIKTKNILSLLAKTKKYQLIDSTGKKCDRSKEQIMELVGSFKEVKQVKEAKEKKEKTEKAISKKDTVLELHKEGLTVKEIIAETGFNYTTVYGSVNDYTIKKLFNECKPASVIAEIVGRKEDFITNWLKRYKFID